MPLLKFQTIIIGVISGVCLLYVAQSVASADPGITSTPIVAVGPQYDTTHVYVPAAQFNRFVTSLVETFGGKSTKQGVYMVTPTESRTMSQLALTHAGSISVFGFLTPIPYPFGTERTGYLVTDLDTAVRAAQADGANVIVAPFPDPVGKDAVIQWPGGVNMQLYWHTKAPFYPELATIPENRIYVSPDCADEFVRDFTRFAHGSVVSDDRNASGIEIGRPNYTFRRIRIQSAFGKMVVLVTDGHLPYPYGHEMTGYGVTDLTATLGRATAAGAQILVPQYTVGGRQAAIVQFPGGYIAEVHSVGDE
jgi:predicted enzyme related to lactoylglutathione lyase